MRGNGSVRLLLLDCDGVLVRSERANLAYYNHLFRAFGLPQVPPDAREAVGRLHTLSTPQVIDAFFPPELRERAREHAAGVDYAQFLGELAPEPGWDEVLGRWRARGRTAVATNRGSSARAVLRAVGLLDLVDLVVTSRDVARPKPYPDVLLRALEHFGARPEEALYVGDAELDREAARAAGVGFLGFRTTRAPVAESPAEVEGHLLRLAGGAGPDTLAAFVP
ncbi:MAG: HAD family phosphatase [Thermodesulfobacteriota bacterium]